MQLKISKTLEGLIARSAFNTTRRNLPLAQAISSRWSCSARRGFASPSSSSRHACATGNSTRSVCASSTRSATAGPAPGTVRPKSFPQLRRRAAHKEREYPKHHHGPRPARHSPRPHDRHGPHPRNVRHDPEVIADELQRFAAGGRLPHRGHREQRRADTARNAEKGRDIPHARAVRHGSHASGPRRSDRPGDRPRPRDRARRADPRAAPEKQPDAHRRGRRRQERHRRGARPAHSPRRGALHAGRPPHLRARRRGARRRDEVPRRVRGAHAAAHRRAAPLAGDDPLHRRGAHHRGGAGATQGSLDTANLIKPALARGEIRTIGATTLDEYRTSIEADAALDRRFQRVLVDPTTPETTLQILRHVAPGYERHHNVRYTEEALQACVTLCRTLRHRPSFPGQGHRPARRGRFAGPPACRTRARGPAVDGGRARRRAAGPSRSRPDARLRKGRCHTARRGGPEKPHRRAALRMAAAAQQHPAPITEEAIREVITEMTGVPAERLSQERASGCSVWTATSRSVSWDSSRPSNASLARSAARARGFRRETVRSALFLRGSHGRRQDPCWQRRFRNGSSTSGTD